MIPILLLLSSSLRATDSCAATSPSTMPVPLVPCQGCAAGSLSAVSAGLAGDLTDSTSIVAGCSTRTLVCTDSAGYNSNAQFVYNGSPIVPDNGAGVATMVLTCNAANTAWEYMGTPVTTAECSTMLPALYLALALASTHAISKVDNANTTVSFLAPPPNTVISSNSRLRYEHLQVNSTRRIFKRQAGRVNTAGCGNPQLGMIMQNVVGPLLQTNRLRIGDIAQILQQSVQAATNRSFEIMMGRGEMVTASHQMSDTTGCRMRVGEFYTTVYETPVQYDITNTAQEQFLSNIDFGEPLGGSGYPGQESFPHLSEPEPSQLGQARHPGCGSAQLAQIMQDTAGPLLAANPRMRIGDIARRVQLAVQEATGRSYEVFMGPSDVVTSSYQMTEMSSCRQRINEYYTTVYETPVQYNLLDLAEEQFLANIDFGQELGSNGYPGQQPFPPDPTVWEWVPFNNFVEAPVPVEAPVYYAPAQYAPAAAPPPFLFAQMECFSGDLIVETIEGPKRMDELKTGDEVLSIEESVISFSPIVMFLHRDEEMMAEFNVIMTENGHTVKLTNEHLIYVGDCDEPMRTLRLVRAKEVTTDLCFFAAKSPVRKLGIDKVVNITKTYERGIYAPLTITGDILVNGVLSSCHSNLAMKILQQSLFSLYRSFSFLLPQEGGLPLGLEYLTRALDLFIPTK